MDLISYETIRAVHRAEKDDKLQKLPENFFNSVKHWFDLKRDKKDTTSLLEIENAKKLLDDLISRRERKIMLSALRTVRGEIPPANLIPSEQKLFDEIVIILKDYRGKVRELSIAYDVIVEEKIEDVKKAIEEIHNAENAEEEKVEPPKFSIPDGKKMIKILTDLPKFVGPDMGSYGPFRTGDLVTIPDKVANILIARKSAEDMAE